MTTIAPATATPRQRDAGSRTLALGSRLAVLGLLGGAALNTTEAVLGRVLPARPDAVVDQLRLVAENAGLYGTRAVIGTLAVPLMSLAFVAAAQHLAGRARRTAWAAGSLLLAGMWGFFGMHVLILLQLPASAVADPVAAAEVLEAAQRSPLFGVLFLLPFMVGCVGGMVLLSVALLVTGSVPRWIPSCWLAFIALDFTVGAVGAADPHWLFLLGSVGFARYLWQQRARTVLAA